MYNVGNMVQLLLREMQWVGNNTGRIVGRYVSWRFGFIFSKKGLKNNVLNESGFFFFNVVLS